LSILLILATLIPILTIPLSTPFAFGLLILVHQYGIPWTFSYLPSLCYVFLFFGAIAVGFVGTFLSLYLLLRHYVINPILQRYHSRSDNSQPSESVTISSKRR
jgi:hypothetical protein